MQLWSLASAAERRANHNAGCETSATAVTHAGDLLHNLMKRLQGKTHKLDFDDRFQSGYGQSERGTDDHTFGQRHVHHTFWPKSREEPVGSPEDPTQFPDILTEHHNLVVGLHGRADASSYRLEHVHQGHESCSLGVSTLRVSSAQLLELSLRQFRVGVLKEIIGRGRWQRKRSGERSIDLVRYLVLPI